MGWGAGRGRGLGTVRRALDGRAMGRGVAAAQQVLDDAAVRHHRDGVLRAGAGTSASPRTLFIAIEAGEEVLTGGEAPVEPCRAVE